MEVMGGKPCVRGTRVKVATIVGLIATGSSTADVLDACPYLEEQDISQVPACVAWRIE